MASWPPDSTITVNHCAGRVVEVSETYQILIVEEAGGTPMMPFRYLVSTRNTIYTLPETKTAPENGWLED